MIPANVLKKLDVSSTFGVEITDFRICYSEKAFWFRRPLRQEELHLMALGQLELPPQIILSASEELCKKGIPGFSNKVVLITPDTEYAQIVDIFTDGEDGEEDPNMGFIWLEATFPIQSIEVADVTIMGED